MKRSTVFKELTRGNNIIKKPLAVLGLLKFVFLLLETIPLFLYSLFVDRVLIDKNIDMLGIIIGGYLAVFGASVIWSVINKKYTNKLVIKYDLWLKKQLLRKYIMMEFEEYKLYSIGDIKSRIENDSLTVESFFTKHILDFIYMVIYVMVTGVILICYDWRIAILSFLFVPVSFLVANTLGKKIKQMREHIWNIQAKYDSFLHGTFQNWKDIKANNLEKTHYDKLDRYLNEIRRTSISSQFYEHLGLSYSFFSKNLITQLFIYFIGGSLLIMGHTEIEILLIFVNFYGKFFNNVQMISDSIMNYKNDSVSIEKVVEILKHKSNTHESKKILDSDIKVDNVDFSYRCKGAFLLKDITFNVEKGQHLAIVGESGSGKSTIAKLLTGQIKPNKGSIRIGGVDISTVRFESIAGKVSIVEQEPVLLNMTIKENLLLSKPDADDKEIELCCRRACIFEFIEKLNDKFDTVIGENGIRLSGGQKQRLSLARAFLQNRDIIILDESTSALDRENEAEIINELIRLSDGKTMITIAHRLTTILYCDKVIVIKDGKMEAFGTHDGLRGHNKTYDKLFEGQYVI